MTQELAIRDTSPALGIGESFAELLADLMWVSSVDWDAAWTPAGVPVEGLFRIRGTIKANPKSTSLEGWMNSVTRNYLCILKVITEAGGVYRELPKLDITGTPRYKMDDYPAPHWACMRAQINIELRIPL